MGIYIKQMRCWPPSEGSEPKDALRSAQFYRNIRLLRTDSLAIITYSTPETYTTLIMEILYEKKMYSDKQAQCPGETTGPESRRPGCQVSSATDWRNLRQSV